MQTILFEQPWIIGAIGTILSLATFFGWVQTGNSIARKTGCGLVVATLLLLLLNFWVVSDREVVHQWLEETAIELQNNEYAKTLKRIHPESSDRVANNVERLKHIKFSMVKITKIHSIAITKKLGSKRARIRMNVIAAGSLHGLDGKVPRWVGLTLEKVDDKWLVVDVEDRDPQYEFLNSNEA